MPHDAQQRRQLVDGQLRTADVNDKALLAAILETSRLPFVRGADKSFAYIDRDLLVSAETAAEPRYMLAPMTFGRMAQAVAIQPSDRVLDVGCGTGWSSAVFARMAADVTALDNETEIAAARAALNGQDRIHLVAGALKKGVAAKAPYDVIVVEGAIEQEPTELLAQLADGGRLVAVHGKGQAGRITLWSRSGSETGSVALLNAAAPLLSDFAMVPSFEF
ncbi:MAG: protein-L-isoaspartate O-methyltransferase [Beijerinckiaceae bacterium]|nr:protein-L-isoaspartate O-methyltransferase [Beijerinckiaceae bacterium]